MGENLHRAKLNDWRTASDSGDIFIHLLIADTMFDYSELSRSGTAPTQSLNQEDSNFSIALEIATEVTLNVMLYNSFSTVLDSC